MRLKGSSVPLRRGGARRKADLLVLGGSLYQTDEPVMRVIYVGGVEHRLNREGHPPVAWHTAALLLKAVEATAPHTVELLQQRVAVTTGSEPDLRRVVDDWLTQHHLLSAAVRSMVGEAVETWRNLDPPAGQFGRGVDVNIAAEDAAGPPFLELPVFEFTWGLPQAPDREHVSWGAGTANPGWRPWCEDEQQFLKRARAAFEADLAKYLSQARAELKRRGAAEVPATTDLRPFEWTVRYQVLEHPFTRIARSVDEARPEPGEDTTAAVRVAVRKIREILGLGSRQGPGRPARN
jgi:hypothetical protein